MKYAILFYTVMTALTFLCYGRDKKKARKHRWRTPESILLGLGLLGGAVGALLGMQIFRHKTRHWYFWAVNLVAALLHAFFAWKLIV